MLKCKSYLSIFLLLSFCLIALNGCSLKVPNLFPKEVPTSNLPAEALVIDDAIYSRISSLIDSAKTSIYVEQAEFDDPRLIQQLITKANSGVDVRILLDQWQKENRATLDQLKSQNSPNISIQFYPAQKGQLNHTKLLIIDQKLSLINGPPWTNSGFKTHDFAVELSGKSAWKAAGIFSKDWEFTTTFSLPVTKTSPLPEDNIVLAVNANVKQQLTDLISASTKSIWVENPEITDPDLILALTTAAEKGRDVRIIGDRAVYTKTPVTLEKLQTKGVQIRYYPITPILGTHIAIFDNKSFNLSSSGWTHYSFLANHEFSITVPSPTATAKTAELFNQDWEKSTK
ncbi:MAG: phosphatidylserine/phosphatidylglycerophosphate/cardiolipin synthase family protein [Bacillota bacterium]|nr:phosphatidylserine/phosphatidylglycerophosphate/cardiolipin synthase family protein [Bacillota bacterium]